MTGNQQASEDRVKTKVHIRDLVHGLVHRSSGIKQPRTAQTARHNISLPLNLISPIPPATAALAPTPTQECVPRYRKDTDATDQAENRNEMVFDNTSCLLLSPISASNNSGLHPPFETRPRQALSILSSVAPLTLRSTSFTITSPLFSHGLIRLDSSLRTDSSHSPNEEHLDWVAFQIALSGMTELPQDNYDASVLQSEVDEDEADSIITWWTGFGFPGYGQLVCEQDIKNDNRTGAIKNFVTTPLHHTDNVILIRDWDQDVKIADIPHNITLRTVIPEDRFSLVDLSSLPPSPMSDMPLTGDGKDFIPMGFNLMHDL